MSEIVWMSASGYILCLEILFFLIFILIKFW